MLTIRTSATIPTNRHRRDFRFSPASTGLGSGRSNAALLVRGWMRLLDAEARRLWLETSWRSHVGQVQSRRARRMP